MKGYLLFCDFSYYPSGGWWDFRGVFATPDAAKAALPTRQDYSDPTKRVDEWDWYHIVDAETGKVVEAVGGSCYGNPETLLNPEKEGE